MKLFLQISIILIFFTSCYTAKQAQRDIIKADLNHPIVTSGFCAEKFPPKEKITERTKFIKGETIIKKDTITIDCDSVVSDKTQTNKVLVEYNTIYQTDTIVKEKIIQIENTAKTKNFELQIEKLESIKKQNEAKITELENSNSNLWKYLILSIIANVVLTIVVIKK